VFQADANEIEREFWLAKIHRNVFDERLATNVSRLSIFHRHCCKLLSSFATSIDCRRIDGSTSTG
jgi:hypothetical protein